MIAKLNVVSFAAAMLFFFLPWLDFQCSEKVVVTQSGFQTIYGGGTVAPEFESEKKEPKKGDSSSDIGGAVLIGGAFCCVLGGLIFSLIGMFQRGRSHIAIPILAGIALILVALQIKVGFPMERSVTKAAKPEEKKAASFGNLFASINMKVVYRPWVYLELGALVSPLGIAFFSMKLREES